MKDIENNKFNNMSSRDIFMLAMIIIPFILIISLVYKESIQYKEYKYTIYNGSSKIAGTNKFSYENKEKCINFINDKNKKVIFCSNDMKIIENN